MFNNAFKFINNVFGDIYTTLKNSPFIFIIEKCIITRYVYLVYMARMYYLEVA